jgi:hypothetical protein
MESLPDLLCSSTVPVTAVEIMGKLARQNNPFFYKSLCQKLPKILSKYSQYNWPYHLCTSSEIRVTWS